MQLQQLNQIISISNEQLQIQYGVKEAFGKTGSELSQIIFAICYFSSFYRTSAQLDVRGLC